jgi:urease accessory protein UreF
MPLGQTRAQQILWGLKPSIIAAVSSNADAFDEISSFAPLLELGSMRHTTLTTRLFIS